MDPITYTTDLTHDDWQEMKSTLAADDFDNGRTPDQLRQSFANSYVAVVAYDGPRIVGTARALADGVCNAYVVDVWTLSSHRRRGIATRMMSLLLSRLDGHHVYLFSDDRADFYKTLGFEPQPEGLSKVVGQWLRPRT
jgi:predicted GNAT family acetyltransferase